MALKQGAFCASVHAAATLQGVSKGAICIMHGILKGFLLSSLTSAPDKRVQKFRYIDGSILTLDACVALSVTNLFQRNVCPHWAGQ